MIGFYRPEVGCLGYNCIIQMIWSYIKRDAKVGIQCFMSYDIYIYLLLRFFNTLLSRKFSKCPLSTLQYSTKLSSTRWHTLLHKFRSASTQINASKINSFNSSSVWGFSHKLDSLLRPPPSKKKSIKSGEHGSHDVRSNVVRRFG